ncbi:hypothetical protein MTR67_044056 [Solanum verrucosum]|uniref:Uncharacterized protein n=1 Tax=Solanum verrucosum TaxID=315347 RepID=A0AAF0ZT88_SOLVR|nr:hypothetical protein MTR67_044056 [Solanum verrucosum]
MSEKILIILAMQWVILTDRCLDKPYVFTSGLQEIQGCRLALKIRHWAPFEPEGNLRSALDITRRRMRKLSVQQKRACLAAAFVLRKGAGGCIDAVTTTIQVLEVLQLLHAFFLKTL